MATELTGKHILVIFLTFFGVIFTVNGIMIFYSQYSWTGLETSDAYRKGLKYNQQLSSSEAQNKRGWHVDVKRNKLTKGGMSFQVNPKDKDGEALTQLNIVIDLVRPTHEGMDQHFRLKETDLGVYDGKTASLPLGKWYIFITASRKGETLYKSKNELYLR